MYCPTCGNNLTIGTRFCGHCGTQLDATTTSTETAQAQTPTPAQPATSQTIPPEQSVRQSFTYITSYLTFYLKGTVDVEADRVHLNTPNTILGFIPLGSQKRTLDIKHIVEVESDFHVSILALLIGLFLTPFTLEGFSAFGEGDSGSGLLYLILGLWGISMILNAFSTTVTISLASSEKIALSLVIFEKGKADAIADALNKALLLRTRDTNFRVHADRSMHHTTHQTDRIIDAINQSHS